MQCKKPRRTASSVYQLNFEQLSISHTRNDLYRPHSAPKQKQGKQQRRTAAKGKKAPLHLLVLVPKTSGYRGGSASHCAPPLVFTAEAGYGAPSFPHAFHAGIRHKKTPRTRYARSSRAMLRPIKTRVLVRKASGGAAYTWYVRLRGTQWTRFRPSKAGSDAQGAQVRCVLDVRERLWNAAHQVPQLTTRRLRRLPSGRR